MALSGLFVTRLSPRAASRPRLTNLDGIRSEFQSGFTSRFGQRFHATMESVTGAIERDLGNAELLRLFSNAATDFCRSLDVAAVLDVRFHVALGRRRARQHLAARGIDHLGVNVRVGPVHR